MWNGIGWYGFIGVITTSTTDISLHNILSVCIYYLSLFQVQCYLPLSIINNGVPKHAGSQVSDRCPLGYLFSSLEHLAHDELL